MLSDLPTPIIIAHRGASAHAPENTLRACRLALEQQAEGVELDVHLSADNQVVVIHDHDVSRTTDGSGLVHSLTLSEIRLLDAGQEEQVPTLREVLDLIQDQAIINIELKGFRKAAQLLPEKVIDLVQDSGLGNKIIYSSFNPRLLVKIRQLLPKARLGLLLPPGALGAILRFMLTPMVRPWSLHPHFASINTTLMRNAKRKRRPVICYTVNSPHEMQRVASMGVKGIITDYPALAVRMREAAQ